MKNQLDLFKLIGNTLKEKTECVLIGGSAMMFYNCKESTKDIDLVAFNKKNFNSLKEALLTLSFKSRSSSFKYKELSKEKPIILENKEKQRIDLFLKEVICFEITDSILTRIREVHEFNNLIIKVIAPEDIIFLKCATERAGDRIDAAELIKIFNIDWKIIVKEAVDQSKKGKGLYSIFLYDFLTELKEDFKLGIPKEILVNLMRMGEEAIVKAKRNGSLIKVKKFGEKKK